MSLFGKKLYFCFAENDADLIETYLNLIVACLASIHFKASNIIDSTVCRFIQTNIGDFIR